MNPDCIFCKIGSHELPAALRYEDELVCAFDDIHPKTPVHILIIPRRHIPTIDDLNQEDGPTLEAMLFTAQRLARDLKIAEMGYRLIFNVRAHGGQEVDHIHLHLLGGKPLGPMAG